MPAKVPPAVYSIEVGGVYATDSKSQTRRFVCALESELAIAFDKRTGVLLRHGNAKSVQEFVEKQRARLRSAGFHREVEDLIHVTFPVTEETVAGLNKCVDVTGYLKTFLFDLKNIIERISDEAAPAVR